ncbi:MAG: biosynthetic arginine decarboxylase [Opitutales bacterium]
MSKQTPWTIKDADDYYGFKRWGGSHFTVDPRGNLCVHPLGDDRKIRILDIVREAESMGLKPPLTIRVQDLLRRRVVQLNESFIKAVDSEDYPGKYRGVFPIKVNQLREVVEEILDAGEPYGFGLEAGSKPELLIALAILESNGPLLICNGYKDDEFIELALMGRKLGKQTIIVVEQVSEVDAIIRTARRMGVVPHIGIRVKLTATGEGKWAESTGENAKFGLTASEIMVAVDKLRRARMTEALRLVHFHIGSQVPNIATIKKAVVEAARYYCELAKMGFPMGLLDVGGGLGIDYDGSRSAFESSMNYSMEVYARDVVASIKQVCDASGVTPPDIVSESGRALVAPHSILIFEAVDRIARDGNAGAPPRGKSHPVIRELEAILTNKRKYDPLERYHDAKEKKEEAHSRFTLGYLTLEQRAYVDRLFWQICRDLRSKLAHQHDIPDELARLDSMLAEQYVCNFSVFQSLLDHWALDQLFPIAPIHRLNERPTVQATLADITCDSDGKVDDFIDLEDVRRTLALHPLKSDEPYYIGAFMVGAYQDIMGDLHNLFGRVNEAHVFLEDDEEDGFYLEETLEGYSVERILGMIQYNAEDLCRMLKRQVDRATRADSVKPREGVAMVDLYERLIRGKTYLIPHRAVKKARVMKSKSSAKSPRKARR